MIPKDIYKYTCENKLGWRQASVHNNTKRFDKAKEQEKLDRIDIQQIINHTNDFLEKIGIRRVEEPFRRDFKFVENSREKFIDLNYEKIKEENGLNNTKHIIWMKFTKDKHLGVVAAGDDINFQIPNSPLEYNEKETDRKWKYNTSGIIIHHLRKIWDENFVLVFPLPNIGNKQRSDIECAIGNYLISKKCLY
ncbi:hypothetical protein [Clostridium saccharoperbutylacetonicum]|uniref:hypothetical protein n=1 Tax=Clostridium saccharoperbutylacetonicum TaxID=36745 RepID=UPI0039ED5CBD